MSLAGASISMPIDGFITGPDEPGAGPGRGGTRLPGNLTTPIRPGRTAITGSQHAAHLRFRVIR